jgi:hypothetical protein
MLHKLLATAAWSALALIVFVTVSPIDLRPVAMADPNIERFAAFALLGLLFGFKHLPVARCPPASNREEACETE